MKDPKRVKPLLFSFELDDQFQCAILEAFAGLHKGQRTPVLVRILRCFFAGIKAEEYTKTMISVYHDQDETKRLLARALSVFQDPIPDEPEQPQETVASAPIAMIEEEDDHVGDHKAFQNLTD